MKRILIILICLQGMAYANTCSMPFYEKMSIQKLKDLVKNCKDIDTVDKLISYLPISYRDNWIAMFVARALGNGSIHYPRISLSHYPVKIGEDVMISSFGGHPSLAGYDSFEFIEFNAKKKEFEFGFVKFPKDDGNFSNLIRYQFSESNPVVCMACHKQQNFLWELSNTWPGLYIPETREKAHPFEVQAFDDFWQRKKLAERYRYLSDSYENVGPKFSRITYVVNSQWMAKVLRELFTSEDLKAYQASLLLALSCKEADYKKLFPKTQQRNLRLSQAQSQSELYAEINLVHSWLQYLQEYSQGLFGIENPELDFRFFNAQRIEQFYFLFRNLNLNFQYWSPSLRVDLKPNFLFDDGSGDNLLAQESFRELADYNHQIQRLWQKCEPFVKFQECVEKEKLCASLRELNDKALSPFNLD